MKHFFLFFLFFIIPSLVFGQMTLQGAQDYIYGRWKCIKHDYRGEESFNLKQAEAIRHSTLNIGNTKFYYEGLDFIESCSYVKFKAEHYDTTIFFGSVLEREYNNEYLYRNIIYVTPVDSSGESTCFNNCSIFYFKNDTLISICGGYTFYRIKIEDSTKRKNRSYPVRAIECNSGGR